MLPDFFLYKSGVYHHDPSIIAHLPHPFRQQDWHSVRIIGWVNIIYIFSENNIDILFIQVLLIFAINLTGTLMLFSTFIKYHN